MRTWKTLISFICLVLLYASCTKDPVENKPPVVITGSDTTINLARSTDSIKLNGSATDADGSVVGYLWSQISGPNTIVITAPGSPSTFARGFVTGSYVFQLMATDNKGATGVKTIKITVNVPQVVNLVLQPTNNPNEVLLAFISPSTNASDINAPEIGAETWTVNGNLTYVRSLVKFDLSSISSNATILSAKLSLYSSLTPKNGDLIHANFGTNNTMLLQRTLTSWSPATITWQNQPAGDASSQIVIPHTNQSFLDLPDLDVTSQVQAMIQNGNFGFLMKMQTEVIYNSRIIASSKYADASLHPKLVVQYVN